MSTKIKEISIAYDDGKVGGLSFGDPNKDLLISFHGWLDNAASFKPLAPYLENDFYVMAFDLPGHGNSYHLETKAHYHIMDSVFFIEKLRRELKIEKINFLCHSLGGVLAGLYSGIFPEKVNIIFSIEALGPITDSVDITSEKARSYIEKRISIEQRSAKFHKSLESCINARIRDGRLGPEEAKILIERGVNESENGFAWKFDQRLNLPSVVRMTEEQTEEIMSHITAPYHLIKGNYEFAMLEKAMSYRSKYVKNFKIHELKGGHHLHMEHPEEVARVVIEEYKKANS